MLRSQGAEHQELAPDDKRGNWLKALKWASSSLEGIEHAFVKLLTNPPIFTDLDIMVPDEGEREKALEALGGREEFFKGAILEGPGRFIRRLGSLDLDIYPNACWGGFKVADGKEIVERRSRRRSFGIEIEIPSPDDAFYLIATHAYSHLRIRREEMENCRHLSLDPEFDVSRIAELAESYGTEPAVSIFCNALDIDVGLDYEGLKLDKSGRFEISIEIPKTDILRNFHTHRLLGKTSSRELASDFAWHVVRPVTKFVGFK